MEIVGEIHLPYQWLYIMSLSPSIPTVCSHWLEEFGLGAEYGGGSKRMSAGGWQANYIFHSEL